MIISDNHDNEALHDRWIISILLILYKRDKIYC